MRIIINCINSDLNPWFHWAYSRILNFQSVLRLSGAWESLIQL